MTDLQPLWVLGCYLAAAPAPAPAAAAALAASPVMPVCAVPVPTADRYR